jgi:spermidine synthase
VTDVAFGSDPPSLAGTATPFTRRRWIYVAAFGCAACGLAYELVLVNLGGSLVGSALTQSSLVISTMVFAMGVGAILAKRWLARPLAAFVVCEPLVALLGGLAPMLLLASFAWMDVYQPVVVGVSFAIGVLVGAEVPLLYALLPRRNDSTFAELLAADYLGALLAGLAVPFLIVPRLGMATGSLAIALVNVVMGLLILVDQRAMSDRFTVRLAIGTSGTVALALLGALLGGPRFERSVRQQFYEDPIVTSMQTPYQDIVVTESWQLTGASDTRLFINGDLQFSSRDEYRYHEALVHPVMAGNHQRVLILGGGDGLALREVVTYPDVESIELVDLDPAMVDLARRDERLRRLNGDAFADPRVTAIADDAFTYVRSLDARQFDVVIVDLPDPDSMALAKLYSVEFYAMASQALADDGRMVIQAGSPAFAPEAFWSIVASVEETGLQAMPFHIDVPSFGDWGYVLASSTQPQLRLDAPGPLRSLDDASLLASAAFAPDRARRRVEISTLLDPRIIEYERRGWQGY